MRSKNPEIPIHVTWREGKAVGAKLHCGEAASARSFDLASCTGDALTRLQNTGHAS